LDKNGIVKDPKNYKKVEQEIKTICHKLGYKVYDYFSSSIKGTDGNKEFFIFLGH
jgi:23S rRNA (cytidine1920-2'-O)/16S rRNA (cytidine1409-2'-O)-methyltransferase